jgi:4-aminobutyrate aminotransferase
MVIDKTKTLPGPKGKELIERDEAVISPSYTRSYPFAMARGEGAEVWDVDGNRFIDFTTGIAVTATGHTHPEVVQAIKDQADQFIHMAGTDFYYEVEIELAERLNEIAPFEEDAQVFFTNSGTEAVEAAVKLARYTTGRPRFIGFYGGFHGRSMGSLAFTASKYTQQAGFFPTMPGVTHVPYPDVYRPALNSDGFDDYGEAVVRYIENVLFATNVPADEVAAVVVEPIQGEGGYLVPTGGFFPALRALCDRHGILLIADEVQSGMGRTGKWWAIEHWGVEPDIVLSAKGIASGMPLGAMIARKSLMTWPPGAHGNTFGANPISCAAALATIRLIGGGMMENAATMGTYIMDALHEIAPRHPSIGDIRGKGMMIGIDLVENPESRKPAIALRDEAVDRAYEKGLLLLGCGQGGLRFMPPLNLEKAIADEALQVFDGVLAEAEAAHGA